MRKKRRTPQQKKTLSLSRDRRNRYGQNAKASRKLIPLRKAKAKRSVRHAANQALRSHGQDRSDTQQKVKSRGRWRKVADASLGETVQRRLRRQSEFGQRDNMG